MKKALTRARILGEAQVLAERDGLDRLSMRRLADHLGVAPMSLYTHISGKEELLDGIVEELMSDVAMPFVEGADPYERVREMAHALRAAARASPEVFRIIAVRKPSAVFLSILDVEIANLQRMGFAGGRAAEALRVSLAFVFGYMRLETGGFFPALATASNEETSRFPAFDQISSHLREWDSDAEFDAGLDVLLSGIATR